MLLGRVRAPAPGDSASAALHANNSTDECCLDMYPTTFSVLLDREPATLCEPGSTASAPAVQRNVFNIGSYSATTTLPWEGFMNSSNLRPCALPPPHVPIMEEGGSSCAPYDYNWQQQYSEQSPTSSDMGGGGETPAAGSPAIGVSCSSLSAPATFCGVMPSLSAPATAVLPASTAQTVLHASAPEAHRSSAKSGAGGSSTALMLQQLLEQQQQLQQQLQQQQRWHMEAASSDGFSPGLISLQLRGLQQQQQQQRDSGGPSDASADVLKLPSTAAARTLSVQPPSQPSPSTAAKAARVPFSIAADSTAPAGSGGGGVLRSGSGEMSIGFLKSLKRSLDTNEQHFPPFLQHTHDGSGSSGPQPTHMGNNTRNRDAQRRFRQRQREAFASMEARVRAQEQRLQALYREKRMVEQHNEVLLKQLRAYEQKAERQQQQQQEEEEQKRQQARPPADNDHDDSYRPHLCCLCGSAILQQG